MLSLKGYIVKNIIRFVLLIVLSGCGTIATPIWEARPTEVAQLVSPVPPTRAPSATPSPTPTPLPTRTPTSLPPTATPILPTSSPLPIATIAVLAGADGDPVRGKELFNTFQPLASFACATCHRVDSEERLIGPGLLNVSIRAETRVAGMSAVDYIHTSIVNPGAFVVDTFPDELMPKNWAEIYSEDDISDLIAYLFTLTD